MKILILSLMLFLFFGTQTLAENKTYWANLAYNISTSVLQNMSDAVLYSPILQPPVMLYYKSSLFQYLTSPNFRISDLEGMEKKVICSRFNQEPIL